MQLSPHFSLDELRTTSRAGFAVPQVDGSSKGTAVRTALQALCSTLLEPVRIHVDRPVRITSGYRSPSLNAATPGASKTSQHVLGQAADLQVPGFTDADLEALWAWIAWDSGLPFGQVIFEDKRPTEEGGAWIHLSLGVGFRAPERCGQVLRWTPAGGYARIPRPG